MILYHMSQTLKCGDTLIPDFQKLEVLCEPFIQALERSKDCFYGMLLNGKYMYAVLCRSGLREWSNYAKWATEGLFEFVRRNEFPDCCGRLNSFFFYDDLNYSKKLYWDEWSGESEEERSKVHLFEVELDDNMPQKRDMSLFDKAYDAIEQKNDVEAALVCARQYFAGEQSDAPVWEILSNKKPLYVGILRAACKSPLVEKLQNPLGTKGRTSVHTNRQPTHRASSGGTSLICKLLMTM